jgi:hypothetical protein
MHGACSNGRTRRAGRLIAFSKTGVMAQSDQIGEYLQQLTPQARSSLLIELERLEVCGAAIPGAAAVLEKLRAEFRKGGRTQNRVANPSRHFFTPLEPMLVDGAPEHDNSGRILRGSLAAIWEWISHDLLPTMARDYDDQMKPLIAADNQPEIRKAAAIFQTKVFKYLENALGAPAGADRARTKLATYTASRSVYGDLTRMVSVLGARDALAKLNKELPASIMEFDEAQVATMTALLDAFRKQSAAALPFALTLVAKRLKTFWQLVRLATEAAPSKNAADIAATPYAIVVSMVLDRLEDKGAAVRVALKNNRILVAKEILTEIYDTEYALQVRIGQLEQSDWGMRLNKIMNAIAAEVEAEVRKFPEEVGHVLESLNQRRRQSLADRLTQVASKGRDAFNSGVASCMKLIGQV